MATSYSNRFALVLAGGDGSRLKSFTKKLLGHEVPKQFCPIFSSEPLLCETLDRTSKIIAPDHTLISLNREHLQFYSVMFQRGPQLLVEEPCNRGTAPAILHALMALYEREPSAIVGIFPCDHYISDEALFIDYVLLAYNAASNSDQCVVILGAEATEPERAYGWIEPGAPVEALGGQLLTVRRFVEKPDAGLANELWKSGALWNTFILVARVSALLRMFAATVPRLFGLFSDVRPSSRTATNPDVLVRLYSRIADSGFSEIVLQRSAANLVVIPMQDVEWCDLGEPARVMRIAQRRGTSFNAVFTQYPKDEGVSSAPERKRILDDLQPPLKRK